MSYWNIVFTNTLEYHSDKVWKPKGQNVLWKSLISSIHAQCLLDQNHSQCDEMFTTGDTQRFSMSLLMLGICSWKGIDMSIVESIKIKCWQDMTPLCYFAPKDMSWKSYSLRFAHNLVSKISNKKLMARWVGATFFKSCGRIR